MPKAVVSVRLDEDLVGELDRLAGDCRISRSKLVEKILMRFFEQDRIAQNALLGRKEAAHV